MIHTHTHICWGDDRESEIERQTDSQTDSQDRQSDRDGWVES